MVKITRKDFLGLSAAAVTSAALGGVVAPGTARAATVTAGGGARRTIIRGADVLTMDPKLGELSETDVLLEDDRIAAIGKGLSAADAEIVDAKDMILMPGMCDGHRHVWQIVDAGRLVKTKPSAYAHYQEWKMRTIVSMTPEDHYLGGYLGGLLAIDSGVTSLIDYAHGQIDTDTALAAAQGLKDSGIGGWFAFQLGVAPTYKPGDTIAKRVADGQRVAPSTEAHWSTAERLQRELFSDSSARLQLGLAPSLGMGDSLRDISAEWTRARDMGVKLLAAHVHKPATPAPAGIMGHRDSGIRDLQEAGLLGPDYHVAHGNRLTADELRMLRDTGGMVCATAMGEFPYMTSVHRGASVHGRARAAGVATGVGIDVNLVLTQDYFEHARAAFWSLYLEPESVAIAEGYESVDTLDFVTALGARAMRLDDVAGSITVGKRADLVLLKTDRPGFALNGTLADRVLNFASLPDIDSVWVAGKARKRNGRMAGVDWAKLKADVATAQERIGPLAASITFT